MTSANVADRDCDPRIQVSLPPWNRQMHKEMQSSQGLVDTQYTIVYTQQMS